MARTLKRKSEELAKTCRSTVLQNPDSERLSVNMTSLLENLFSPLSHLLYLRPMIFAW
jgi:hypothetical protein